MKAYLQRGNLQVVCVCVCVRAREREIVCVRLCKHRYRNMRNILFCDIPYDLRITHTVSLECQGVLSGSFL